ncbi:NAD-dependent epimerase/dehydratase family protein [Treponema primitia]|uniref:NAD-dependent epimerase/dehydratase family protein n=1 Tax=Treponema primitia TaxID=88058 RepID=UPI0039806B0D
MKILFIGGNGNISWYCVQKALEAGHDVWELNRGVTSKTRREIQAKVHKLTGDIRNHEEIRKVLGDMKFDVVADFICYNKKFAEFDIDLFRDKTKHFIFISSVVVYQRKTKYLPYSENTPQWDETDYNYALDKIYAERVFMDAYNQFDFPVTIVRPAHTYDTIIPISLGHNCFTAPQRCLDGKPVLIAGDGTNLWTLTHSKDFARAFVGLMGCSSAIGEDFHITGDEWLTWLDIMKILLDTLGVKTPKYVHIPADEILKMNIPVSTHMAISFFGKAFAGQRMWCDIYNNSKIKKFVPGWKSEISFKEGIKETIDWMFEKNIRRRINPDLNNLLEELTLKYNKS